MKKKFLTLICAMLMVGSLSGCASISRWGKDIGSDFSGGLQRTVEVYDYSGNLLKSYTGKIDLEANEEGKVKFDLNGKRYVIYNAIVVVEEQ